MKNAITKLLCSSLRVHYCGDFCYFFANIWLTFIIISFGRAVICHVLPQISYFTVKCKLFRLYKCLKLKYNLYLKICGWLVTTNSHNQDIRVASWLQSNWNSFRSSISILLSSINKHSFLLFFELCMGLTPNSFNTNYLNKCVDVVLRGSVWHVQVTWCQMWK